jgi:hypothetical protein
MLEMSHQSTNICYFLTAVANRYRENHVTGMILFNWLVRPLCLTILGLKAEDPGHSESKAGACSGPRYQGLAK